MVCTCV